MIRGLDFDLLKSLSRKRLDRFGPFRHMTVHDNRSATFAIDSLGHRLNLNGLLSGLGLIRNPSFLLSSFLRLLILIPIILNIVEET